MRNDRSFLCIIDSFARNRGDNADSLDHHCSYYFITVINSQSTAKEQRMRSPLRSMI